MKNYDIKPYVSVGEIKLGMTPSQVAVYFSAPDKIDIDKAEDELTEYRNESRIIAIYKYSNSKLVELGFGPNIKELNYNNIKLFEEKPITVLKKLIKEDSEPFEHVGFIVFFKLGLALTGFFHGDEDDKAVSVFAVGRWEFIKSKMKPFKLR